MAWHIYVPAPGGEWLQDLHVFHIIIAHTAIFYATGPANQDVIFSPKIMLKPSTIESRCYYGPSLQKRPSKSTRVGWVPMIGTHEGLKSK